MSNVFKYTLNNGYYYDSWISKLADRNKYPISVDLVKCFNEALQFYNREEFKVGVLSTLDYKPEPKIEKATLLHTKYWGLAPTIDYRCTGYSVLNGLSKLKTNANMRSQILSGWFYNDTNEGINTLVVDGVQDHFRYGTNDFNNDPELYDDLMSNNFMFTNNNNPDIEQDVIFYCELEPVYKSQWITGSGNVFTHFDPVTLTHINPMTLAEVKTKYIDKVGENLCIKSFTAYSNTHGLPRNPINKKSNGRINETSPYVEFLLQGNYLHFIPLYGLMYDGCCPNYGDFNLFNNNIPKLIFTPFLHKYGYFKEPPVFKSQGSVTSELLRLDKHILSFTVGSEAEYRKLFNDLGLKVTFIKDEAINIPVEDWSEVPVTPEPPTPEPPSVDDPNLPDTPFRPDTGHANGNGGQEGGQVDNELKPPISPDSDLQEEGVSTGVKHASVSWAMTEEEVNDLNFTFLSGDLWTNIPSWFSNPQQAIISLLKFPFSLPNISSDHISQSDQLVVIANVPMETIDKQVHGRIMHHKFKTRLKICEFNIKRFFNSYLDFEPYTKIKIYMPYIGNVDLPVDYIMGKNIELFYDINYIDGSVLALIKLTQEYGGHIVLTTSGSIGINIPVAKSDAQANTMSAMKSIASLGLGIATAGATGGVGSALMTGVQGAVSTALSNTRQTTATMDRPSAEHTRAISSSPYLIYERPITNMPSNYSQIRGIATNIYKPLKEMAGFTVCKNVKLDNLTRALSSEVDEIRHILESGAIFGKPKGGNNNE